MYPGPECCRKNLSRELEKHRTGTGALLTSLDTIEDLFTLGTVFFCKDCKRKWKVSWTEIKEE
jgi:hypothetical protein